MSKNLAHPLHSVHDDGKGGGWKWWEEHFVLLNSHISAYATCFARKVCSLVRSTWGTSLGEDKLEARDRIARRPCAGRAQGKHSPLAEGKGGSFMSVIDSSQHCTTHCQPHAVCLEVVFGHA